MLSPQALKVLVSCLSKSSLSVTKSILGLEISLDMVIALTNITIVKDLPEP